VRPIPDCLLPSTPAPRQPDALGDGHISGVTSTGSSCAGPVTVTIAISSPASADRELWLMAIVMTGAPVHPVYYAKKELDNVAGQQTATILFFRRDQRFRPQPGHREQCPRVLHLAETEPGQRR